MNNETETRSRVRFTPKVRALWGEGEIHGRGVIWLALVAISCVALLAGASGVLVQKEFHQYSSLKWLITIAAPLIVILLLTVRRPSLFVGAMMVFAIPLEPYVTTIGQQHISILFVTLLLASIVVTLEGNASTKSTKSSLGKALPWIVTLLIVPTALGTDPIHEIMYVLLLVDIGWICVRIASIYPDGRLLLVLFFIASAGVQSSLALIEYSSGHSFNLYGGAGTSTYSAQNYFFDFGTSIRTTGTFFDPISLGNVLAMALPLAVLVLLRREIRASYRIFAVVMAVLIIAGLGVSLSRASWIAAAGGVVCVAIFSSGKQRLHAITLSISLIVGSLLLAAALYGPAIATRFDSIFHPTASTVVTSQGDKARRADWNISFGIFEKNPLAGVGFGSLAERLESVLPGAGASSQAQDTYLQYLAEGGLFGGVALLIFLGGVSVDLFRARDRDFLYPGLVGSSVGVAITWVTDFTVRYYAVAGCLAILVGLIASGGSSRSAGTEYELPHIRFAATV